MVQSRVLFHFREQQAQEHSGKEQCHAGKEDIFPDGHHVDGVVGQQGIERERRQAEAGSDAQLYQSVHEIRKNTRHQEQLKYGKEAQADDGLSCQCHTCVVKEANEHGVDPGMMIAHGELTDDLSILI